MMEDIRVGYSKDHKALYDKLVTDSRSKFYKKQYSDVFIFAIAYAIKEGLAPSKVKGRQGNIPYTAFEKKEWILNALAIAHYKKHDIFADTKMVLNLAEEYANSGIEPLYKEVFETEGDFFKRFESYCREALSKNES